MRGSDATELEQRVNFEEEDDILFNIDVDTSEGVVTLQGCVAKDELAPRLSGSFAKPMA